MHKRDQDQISALGQGRKGDEAKIAELEEQNTQISSLEKENQELSAELEKDYFCRRALHE